MNTICTLRNMLTRNLEYNPDKTAIIEGNRECTFREFADRTNRMGNALLAMGLDKGDRVAILSHNSMENAESYFSIPNAGLVMVMLNFRLAPTEIQTVLTDSEASVLMVRENYLPHIEKIRDELSFVKHFVFIGDPSKTPDGWHHYETLIKSLPPMCRMWKSRKTIWPPSCTPAAQPVRQKAAWPFTATITMQAEV